MKKFLFLMMLLLLSAVSVPLMAQTADGSVDLTGGFATFAALAALTTVVTEIVKKTLTSASGLAIQIMSWVIGILLTIAGWLLNLGFLNGLLWWEMLLYAIGISLTANGIFDFSFLTGLLGKKKPG